MGGQCPPSFESGGAAAPLPPISDATVHVHVMCISEPCISDGIAAIFRCSCSVSYVHDKRVEEYLTLWYICAYVMTKFSCCCTADINECAEEVDSCSQICNNTIGSYECSCENGYRLDPDGHTCNGTI